MTDNKSLYLTLKSNDLIKEEKFLLQPTRNRAKADGYMWEGKLEVISTEGLKFRFKFWHHCHDDDGDTWYPSPSKLDSFWRADMVPKDRISGKLCDADWYMFHVKDHFYISKTGTFSGHRTKKEIVSSITDGTWESDDDIWCLL